MNVAMCFVVPLGHCCAGQGSSNDIDAGSYSDACYLKGEHVVLNASGGEGNSN